MTRLALATGLLLTAAQSWAADMTPAMAFEAGKAFGQSEHGAAAVKGAISGGNAADQVPHYGTSHAHSALYEGGNGDPRTPGGNRVTECATAHYADARQQVECDAINDVAKNRTTRPPLTITPSDPILVKGAAVKADPASVAGAFGGAYGDCKTATVTRPAAYEEEICNEFKTLGEEVCQKTLSVRVDVSQTCTPGAWYSAGKGQRSDGSGYYVDAYCDPHRADGLLRLRFTPYGLHGACETGYADVPVAPFAITQQQELSAGWERICSSDWWGGDSCYVDWVARNVLTHVVFHWKGYCTVRMEIGYAAGNHGCTGNTCSYTFKWVEWRWLTSGINAAGPFAKPAIVVTETDIWDTGACSALEARTQ